MSCCLFLVHLIPSLSLSHTLTFSPTHILSHTHSHSQHSLTHSQEPTKSNSRDAYLTTAIILIITIIELTLSQFKGLNLYHTVNYYDYSLANTPQGRGHPTLQRLYSWSIVQCVFKYTNICCGDKRSMICVKFRVTRVYVCVIFECCVLNTNGCY